MSRTPAKKCAPHRAPSPDDRTGLFVQLPNSTIAEIDRRAKQGVKKWAVVDAAIRATKGRK